MAVTPLPFLDRTAATFKSDVDAFFAQKLPQFSVEVNQVATAADASAESANAAKTAAATSANNAGTSATNAANSASAASSSKTAAAASETNAANSASAASSSKSAAATSETNAAQSAAAAKASADSIGSGPVTSVNTKTGVVSLSAADVGALASGGTAVAATKLATARTIAVGGDATGSASFDGAGNISIPIVVLDDSHNHVISNIDNLQEALDATANLMTKNFLINGNFDIWQRGVSQTVAGFGSADRWNMGHSGGSKTASLQEFPFGSLVPLARFFCRHVVVGGSAAADFTIMSQAIEDLQRYSSGQYTVSFWAKADAARSISIEVVQSFGTGGSPSSAVTGIGSTKIAVTTTWNKYSVTVTLPSISGKTLGTNGDATLVLNVWYSGGTGNNSRTGSLGVQSGTFDIAQIQLEKGAHATAFQVQNYSDIVLQCQRYYQAGSITFAGYSTTGVANAFTVKLPVVMRVVPSIAWMQTSSPNILSSGLASMGADAIQPNAQVAANGGFALNGNYQLNAEY
ncbi:carbohydrate binding domain-containing protein [Pseudomonas lutea]|uniref:carbohydrate binding domain-containing protein n=1 Tax=Pseudomonas lutea TaxID=243924 RepID=UPI0009DF1AAD|nr:carbohydrate binding domain-containing protein [Pseudomonas lutea]